MVDETPRTAATARDALARALAAACYESDPEPEDFEVAEGILGNLPKGWTLAAPEAPGRVAALEAVVDERRRQDAKWGEQNHDLTVWMTVLGEEFGETCYASLHYRAAAGRAENVEGDTDPAGWLAKVRNEAVQTAAVAVAIVEFIDRGMQPTNPAPAPTPSEPVARCEGFHDFARMKCRRCGAEGNVNFSIVGEDERLDITKTTPGGSDD